MEKLSQKSIKKGFNFKSFFKEWGLIFFILIIIAIASAKRPAFLSGSNLINILRSYSTIGIAALGMAYTVIAGGMDLSISSTVSLSAVLTMLVINATTVDRVSPDYASFVVLLIARNTMNNARRQRIACDFRNLPTLFIISRPPSAWLFYSRYPE